MAAQRHVIIHYHIFKNAGSTLAATLERNFGPTFASWDSNEFNAQISGTELLDFLRKHPHILAITSHHLRPPKPHADSLVLHDALVLRHPVDRIRSMYDFYRDALATDDPLTQEAKRLNQRPFFEFLIEHYPHLVTNSQVNYVANQGGKIPDEGDCERACATVRDASVVGVADRFDLCMAVAEQRLGEFYPGLDLSYVSENVSRNRRKGMHERLQEFEKQIGAGLYARLIQLNQFDFKLVDAARDETVSRFKQLPSGDVYLLNFTERVKKRRQERPFALSVEHPGDFSFFTRTE